MPKQKKSNNDWKKLVQDFAMNILEHVSEDISRKTQKWLTKLKKRTAGAALMVLGITFLLTGIAVYANTVLENIVPGIGYAIVGAFIFGGGYFMSRD